MKLKRLIFLVFLASLSLGASAQWMWLDKDGRKVFSDRPPPADIAEKNILKRPSGRGTPVLPSVPEEAPSADKSDATVPTAAKSGNTAPAEGSDKDLEAKKKKAQEEADAKRKAEEARITKAKVENCARAKQDKATLDSGVRISVTNANGEREIMDDAQRAAQAKRIQDVINRDCR
jgi:Domain of unknown function (DUF4124)